MTRVAIVIGAIVLLAGVATAGTVTGLGTDADSPTVSIPDDTGSVGENTVSVPDDTVSVGEQTLSVPDDTFTTETGEDISGPCDEAEHADDPRCTGAVGTVTDRRGDDDRRRRRGPGRGDERHEDRSGPNRGPGRGDERRDDHGGRSANSGPGGGGDD
jgi:hypothetical protein